MIFDKIFNFILYEHVGIVNFNNLVVKYCFDNGKILAYYDLWIEWYVLMLMIEWWSWCHIFGIIISCACLCTLSITHLCLTEIF